MSEWDDDDAVEVDTDFSGGEEDIDIDVDMTGVKAASFAPLPEGEYDFVVSECSPYRAKNSDAIMVKTVLKVPDDNEEFGGRLVYDNQMIGGSKFSPEKSMKFIKKWLIAIGLDEVEADGKLHFNREFFNQFVGNEASAYIKIEERDGKTNNKVAWYL